MKTEKSVLNEEALRRRGKVETVVNRLKPKRQYSGLVRPRGTTMDSLPPVLLRFLANAFRFKCIFVPMPQLLQFLVVFPLNASIFARWNNRFHSVLFRLPDNRLGIIAAGWQQDLRLNDFRGFRLPAIRSGTFSSGRQPCASTAKDILVWLPP